VANLDEQLLYYTIIFLIVFFFGGACNFLAIQHNGGRMPVLYNYTYSSDTHFMYQNPFEIKMWLLSDIFPSKWGVFSIGDVFLTIGASVAIFLLFWYLIRKIKLKIKRYYR
jgi:hypothetical protein